MSKAYRQAQIQKLLRQQMVATHEELLQLLGRIGVETTQTTLSRDLRELGVVKTPQGYRLEEEGSSGSGPAADLNRVFREFLLDVRLAQNLVVIHTRPGSASAVAWAVDRAQSELVVGTIAGDDTLFVATPSPEAATELQTTIHNLWERQDPTEP